MKNISYAQLRSEDPVKRNFVVERPYAHPEIIAHLCRHRAIAIGKN